MTTETLITDGGATADATATTTTTTTPPAGEGAGETTNTSSTQQGEKTGEENGNEGKTDQQKADEEAATKAAEEAAKAAGAPEKYEPFTAPEGVTLSETVLGKFNETARALNLPQDKAQQLINEMAPIMAEQHVQQLEQLRTDWAAQAKVDQEFGGDKLDENLGYAKKAIETFATPELKTILNETGMGNHPELIRFMVRAGKAISEDKIVVGGAPASANRSTADVLYGSSKK